MEKVFTILFRKPLYARTTKFMHSIYVRKNNKAEATAKFYQFQQQRLQGSETKWESGRLNKLKKTFTRLVPETVKYTVAACLIYEKCADEIDWNEFINYFNLPDTFQTWFLLIQLHVWMCAAVLINERNGQGFRNKLIEAMWNDVEHRVKKLAEMKSTYRKKSLIEMSDQFQAALVSYDEGLLGDDTILAAAAWRTIFCFQAIDPRLLESILFYIRKQVSHLDSLNRNDMLLHGTISFLPLKDIVSNINNK